MTLVVRASDRPEPLIDAVRSAIREVDPSQAVFGIKTIGDLASDKYFLWAQAIAALSK